MAIVRAGLFTNCEDVIYLKIDDKWYLFNDESVLQVESDQCLKHLEDAYLIFYRKA